jgi:hypothetical protein
MYVKLMMFNDFPIIYKRLITSWLTIFNNKRNIADTYIIGGGPCGLSAAIEQKKKGIETLVIEKGNVVESIYNYPTNVSIPFFFCSIAALNPHGPPPIMMLSIVCILILL